MLLSLSKLAPWMDSNMNSTMNSSNSNKSNRFAGHAARGATPTNGRWAQYAILTPDGGTFPPQG